jgi:tRNA threonylcarbamoyladenosine biosynthesis protein TsaB
MKTLALEMSTAQGSIALRDDGEPLFDASFAADRKHSGAFFEHVDGCLQRFGQPDRIVVGLGPGSYAGVRIAIATALGLRSASGASLAGVPSICALDVAEVEYAVIGDARRQSFFFARIQSGRLTEGPILEREAELHERLKNSSAAVYASESLPRFPSVRIAYPVACRVAAVVCEIDDVQTLEPIYLREPHITIPKPK